LGAYAERVDLESGGEGEAAETLSGEAGAAVVH